MFRNYLAAALRNLVRNRLYAAINIAGLAVGFAVAALIGLYLRDELTFDRWIPGYENVYRVSFGLNLPGQGADPWDYTPGHVGPWLKLDFPEIKSVARLTHPAADARMSVSHGDKEEAEFIYWADPSLAEVLPLPVIAGNLAAALGNPAGIVLTRRMARKYFGRDNVVGEILEIGHQHSVTVGAVLEDLPSNTHLGAEMIASGLASFSDLARMDAVPGAQVGQTFTYVRLAPGASPAKIAGGFPDFLDRRMPPPRAATVRLAHLISYLDLTPLADIHLRQAGLGAMKPAGNIDVIYAVGIIAVLIVMVAGINFVNLMTARAARRAVEVGVRKVMGAKRRQLILQFLGESLIYAALAMVAALVLAHAMAPQLSTLLGYPLDMRRMFDGPALAAGGGLVMIVGIVAGIYPALILSAFQPSRVFRLAQRESGRTEVLRRVLVTIQFAVLITLILATGVIYRQTSYGMHQSMRFRQDQIVVVETSCAPGLRDAAQQIQGVLEVACAAGVLDGFDSGGVMGAGRDGTALSYLVNYTDSDFFHLYGISPVAGRLFAAGRTVDGDTGKAGISGGSAIINESAVHYLGFASPAAAIGQTLPVLNREIVGVVPDFQMRSVREPVQATAYTPGDATRYKFMSLRIAGDQLPGALTQLDQIWKRLGDKQRPILRFFYDQYVNDLYAELARQGALLSVLSTIAIVIAGFGLFGLAAFTAERRTKEIGVRKALGASKTDILRLLVWEFSKPVLWANVLAWPVSYFAMRRWLEGFALHIDLTPWVFLAATVLALAIAVLTVVGHALLVARTAPVAALRYE